jgi:hypothetical protein
MLEDSFRLLGCAGRHLNLDTKNSFHKQYIVTVFSSDKTVFVCAVTGLSGK